MAYQPITGLTVTGSDQYAGLFGHIGSGGKVMNVKLEGVQITSDNSSGYAGGVVGYNGGISTLTACYATGSVTGSGSGSGTIYVGGVTGNNDLGTLTACYHAKGTVKGSDGATGGVAGRNFKDSMLGSGIITACYWGGNGQTQGIGDNQAGTTGGTTQVDGTDVTWTSAMTPMNQALQSADWSYELTGELPTLRK